MTEPATDPGRRRRHAAADAAVRVVDLVKDFGRDVHAIGGLSFDIPRGELTSIIGPSGCGKTTTLKIIAGPGRAHVRPRRGGGTAGHRPGPGPRPGVPGLRADAVGDGSAQRRLRPRARGVPRREREAMAREYVAKVGLAGHEDVYPHQLSGGMRQRVGLARALAVDADILLMDEPFASVDEQIRRKFQEDLLNLLSDEDKTVIFVTHSIEEAVYVSDQIVLLTRGPSTVSTSSVPASTTPRGSDSVRRSTAYLDWVERIWHELESYLEELTMTLRGHRVPMVFSLLVWLVIWEVLGRAGWISLIPPLSEVLAAFGEVDVLVELRRGRPHHAAGVRDRDGPVVRDRDRAGDPDGHQPCLRLAHGHVGQHLRELAAHGRRPRADGAARLRPPDDGRHRVPVLGLGDRAGHPGRRRAGQPVAGRDGPLVRRRPPQAVQPIVLRAALPELLAGIRLGLLRGLKGVVIGQLLIAVVGVGYLFELYSRNFLMPEFWSLLIVLFAFAFLASEVVGYFERKVSFYATSR